MENIGNFLTACEALGCVKADLFQTVDLFEAVNMPQVSTTVITLHLYNNIMIPFICL